MFTANALSRTEYVADAARTHTRTVGGSTNTLPNASSENFTGWRLGDVAKVSQALAADHRNRAEPAALGVELTGDDVADSPPTGCDTCGVSQCAEPRRSATPA